VLGLQLRCSESDRLVGAGDIRTRKQAAATQKMLRMEPAIRFSQASVVASGGLHLNPRNPRLSQSSHSLVE
jgi:hypothetical protein